MIKKLLVAVSMAAASIAMAPAAHAAQYLTFDGTSGTFGFDDVTDSPFEHTFEFTVPDDGTGGSTISSSLVSAPTDITFTSVTLNGEEYDLFATGPVEFRSITKTLTAGLQTIVVKGTSGGSGSYSGSLSFTAVPEPATWAMMVGGFGLVGGAMRRRRAQGTIVTA